MNVSKYFFFLVILSNQAFANDNLNDSTKVNETVHQFFDWYLGSIRKHESNQYQPHFIELDNGGTTLEFSVYKKNLLENNCSSNFIVNEIDSYYECVNNLKSIPFKDVGVNTLTDIDEYEDIGCDFGNYFRWIGSMEQIDAIKIIETRFIDSSTAIVIFEQVFYSEDAKEILIGSNSEVRLILVNDVWQIDSIEKLNVA